jgi:hypothetical protein
MWNIAPGIEIKREINSYVGQKYEVKSIYAVAQVYNQRNALKSF